MLLELIKMCKQHIDFSFKCFLRGFGILITWNCFSVSWLWTNRYISFRSYLLLKDIAKIFQRVEIKVYYENFCKILEKYRCYRIEIKTFSEIFHQYCKNLLKCRTLIFSNVFSGLDTCIFTKNELPQVFSRILQRLYVSSFYIS